jgi:DNA-binding response OmpR family regulator
VATILIIESDRAVAALLAAVVEVAGATPTFELDPGGAAPDVLIIEPSVAGALELATGLRDANPNLPIVLVCASLPATDPRLLLESSVLLLKPFGVAELHATLAAFLR